MRKMFLSLCAAMLLAAPAALAQTLVVGNKQADNAGFIDLDKGEMVLTRETGPGPHEVAMSPDGRTAAVVAYGSQAETGRSVHLFDTVTAKEIRSIDLGRHTRPHGIAWLSDGRHLVVTTEGSGHIAILDAQAGEVVDAVATEQDGSHMLAVSPDEGRVYVANLGGESVSVIDLEARELETVLPAGDGSEGIAVTPDGRELWVSNRGEDTVMVFDTESLERKAVIETDGFPIRVAISPDGAHAAVSNARAGTVSVIDTAAKEVVETLALTPDSGAQGVPITVLFTPNGERLFVSLTRAAEVAVIDTATWCQSGTIAAGAGSDGLGYSPHTLDAAK